MPKVKTDDQEKHTEIVWSRVDAVVNLILENDRYLQAKRNGELCREVMEKFQIKERTAFRYIAEAKKEIRKLSDTDKKVAFARAMRDRDYLLQTAKRGIKDEQKKFIVFPDHKLALDIIKDRERLRGLYVEEINVNGVIRTKPDLSGLSTEEIKTIANLKRQ